MNRILWIILAIITGFFTFGCGVDEPEPSPAQPEEVRRTILVYMAARDPYLSGNDLDDISEMLRADIPDGCRLLVFRSCYSEQSKLSEVTAGGLKELKTYPEGTIGADVETLKEVLADSRAMAPAAENGIIFWSHSSGWKAAQKVAPAGRSFGLEGGHQIELADLADALRTVPKLDFIFFDSCYMGCVEVAYELRDVADYMVASVCEVPLPGMPYDRTINHMFETDLPNGLKRAIDANVDYYLNETNEDCPSTLSLIDLSAMDAVAAAAKPILADPENPVGTFQYFSISTPYNSLFVDLRRYMELTSPSTDLTDNFNDALDRAVLHERHTPSIWRTKPITYCSGLSINPNPSSTAYGYQTLSWTIDTQSND